MMMQYLAAALRRLIHEEHGWMPLPEIQAMARKKTPAPVVPATPEQIQLAYRELLGREASPDEIAVHQGNPGGESGVRSTVFSSPEQNQYLAKHSEEGRQLEMEYFKLFTGQQLPKEHFYQWMAERGHNYGSTLANVMGTGQQSQPGYTPPREGGFTGTTIPMPYANGSNPAPQPYGTDATMKPTFNTTSAPGNAGTMNWEMFRAQKAVPPNGLWKQPAQQTGGGTMAPQTQAGSYGASAQNPWAKASDALTSTIKPVSAGFKKPQGGW